MHLRSLFNQCNTILSKSLMYSSDPITPSKKSTNRGSTNGPTSLIDFDGELGGPNVSTSSKDGNSTGNLLDDLAGLSFQSNPMPFGQGGSIALGQDTSTSLALNCLL